MKIQRTKNKNKKLLIIVACITVIALLGSGGVYYYLSQKDVPLAQSDTPPHITKQEAAANQEFHASQKQAFNDQAKESVAHNPKDQKYQETKPAPITEKDLSATIETTPTSVSIITKLGHTASGTCVLEAVNNTNNKSNKQNAQVIYQPEFSSCAGFTIPKESLGSGVWNIKISIKSEGKTLYKTLQHHVQ